MGLFDIFRKPKPVVPLEQLCYDVAYFLLPHYVYNDVQKIIDLCLSTPTAAGPFFYVMACQMRKVEPVMEDAPRFRWHRGDLGRNREFYVLEYPTPPPVDMSQVSPEEIVSGEAAFVLAPHFSGVIRDPGTGNVDYYILGQAPIGGGTTLRSVLQDGVNCNLGPGPEPQLEAFLAAVRDRMKQA